IYRDQRASARKDTNSNHHPTLQVTDANGQLQPLDLSALQATVNRAAEGLEGIDVQAIIDETVKNLYSGVKESDIATTMMMATRTRIEQEPNYTYVTARLLRDELVSTGLAFLGLPADTAENNALEAFLKKGVELDL
ncbi:ATP cone domain-containing protein, partial [Klebsiella pneumoniae]|nr:ATP cone domain-containing protein [Klebsiella pneumoniae]